MENRLDFLNEFDFDNFYTVYFEEENIATYNHEFDDIKFIIKAKENGNISLVFIKNNVKLITCRVDNIDGAMTFMEDCISMIYD